MESLQPEDPRRIGSYRLLARLGAGGMGSVYLGRSASGRTVAVKFIHAELARDRDFRDRFRNEVEAARRVSGPWTAPVLDADTESATPWVATGYVAGPTLQETVARLYGPLPEHSVRALAAGLAEALREIHGSGLIHRDLKPSNVMLTLDGPRVIDFGIARAIDGTALTRTGVVVGTLGFMSPEQVRGERLTPASDVFSLGAVLAYAATGRQPFATEEGSVPSLLFRVVSEPPDLDGMTGPLRDLAERCLAKDAADRPTPAEITGLLDEPAPGPWLPPELLERLGRHAVELLDLEHAPDQAPGRPPTKPHTVAAGAPPPPPPPPSPHPPYTSPPLHGHATLPPGGPGFPPGTIPPPPGHRPSAEPRRGAARAPLVVAAAMLGVVLTGVLVVALSDSGSAGDGSGLDLGPVRNGAVPTALLGTWEGDIFGGGTQRIVIRQGPRKSEIATIRTTDSRGSCEAKGTLDAVASNFLEVSTRVTKSGPSGLCSDGDEHRLTLQANGSVKWKGRGLFNFGTLYKQ